LPRLIDYIDFINEKNFLAGSKGGHSQDNLDEFCTSMLHSLMFPELIRTNLHSPLEIDNTRPSLYLSNEEKMEILVFYRKMIKSFTTVIGSDKSGHLIKLLETALFSVNDLKENFIEVANLDTSGNH